MRKLYILNDGTTMVTENANPGARVGIKEVHELEGLSESEFMELINRRTEFTPVKDKNGKLTELRRGNHSLKVRKAKENI